MALRRHKRGARDGAPAAVAPRLRLAPGGGALLVAAAMAAGAGAYLEAPWEPPPAIGWVLAALGAAVAWGVHARCGGGARAQAWRIAVLAAAFAAAGFVLAQARANAVTSAPLAEAVREAVLTGWVERIDPPSGPRATVGSPQRYVIRVIDVRAARGAPLDAVALKRVRVSAPAGVARLGDRVRVRARLWPPPPPPTPGAYDAQRRLFFDEINALGRAYAVEAVRDVRVPVGHQPARVIAAARGVVAARVQAVGGPGAVVAALVTGHRGDIPPEHAETLRAAGLGHILAISGLHMALAAGGAYWALSFLFASVEPLARRGDPRRWAAAAALLVATAYLVFSGAAVSTQRAYVMAAAVFAALVLRRRALSLRTLAAAGVGVIALRPESAISPGFHMSFAATAALIAAYAEAQRRWSRSAGGGPTPADPDDGWRRRIGRFVMAAVLTSVVAGAVTGPIAGLHFNRVSWVAIPVNIVVMPVFSLWVMPMAATAGVLAPLGAETIPAAAAARGIAFMLTVADWATPETPAVMAAGAPAALALGLAAVAAACAFEAGRWRVAAPLAIGAILIWALSPRPVAWLGANGALVVITTDGAFAAPPYRGDYARGVVMRRAGVAPDDAQPLAALGVCDGLGCVASTARFGGDGAPWRIAVPLRPEALREDCRRADWIVVSRAVAEAASAEAVAACSPARVITPDPAGDVTLYAAPWGVWRRVAGGDDAAARPWRSARRGEAPSRSFRR